MSKKTTIVTPVPKTCPECGKALAADALQGLCPGCLMVRALAGPDAANPLPPGTERAMPTQVGDYELQGMIAQGGMGIVYRARDKRLQRTVALKMVAAGPLATAAEVERFKVEAEAAARLEHPNIVPIYEVGETAGRHFFTMKLVEGGSLAQAIAGKPMAPERAARLLAKVARAVHYAHQRGVLHRDIKPNNILLDAQDEPQLTDFGLAKIAEREAGLTHSLTVLGSANYMAPEQARGESKQLTTAADIYSLGAVLYEALTGRPPFEGETMVETLRQVVDREPLRPSVYAPAVPRDLETICLKCLEKEPASRYASAQELAEELERFLHHEPIHARPSSTRERAVKWVRRNPAIAALLGIILLVSIAGFSAVLWQLHQTTAALQLAQKNALAEATARAPIMKPSLVLGQDTNEPARAMVSAVFSPDGQRILTASQDETAVLWELASGKIIHKLTGHDGGLASAVFSTDGSRILTWSFDTQRRFAFLNPAGQKQVNHPSLQYGDQTVRLWDAETGEMLTLITNTTQISSAALSPDGKLIATAGYDNLAHIWEAATGKLLHTLSGHTAAIIQVQFSPDGRQLLTTSDGMAYEVKFQKGPGFVGGSQSSRTVNEPEIARIWDVATGKQIGSLKNQAKLFQAPDSHTRARYSPDGRWIVTAPASLENFGIWDARTGALRRRLKGHQHEVNDAVFSRDGRFIATAGADNTARIWESATGREVAALTAHEGPVLSVEFSPDGKRLVTASADGTLRIWEAATGKGLAIMKGHERRVYSACFSPDGAKVVSASQDGTARVWEAATLEQLSIALEGHRGEVTFVGFSRDSRRVVTGSSDRTARVWAVPSGKQVSTLQGHASLEQLGARQEILGAVESVALSPDDRFVAIASDDQDAVVIQRYSLGVVPTGGGTPTWPPPNGKPVPFTPARIFEAETGREVIGFPGDGCGMKLVAFSPDGSRVLTASNGRQRKVAVRPGGGNAYSSSGSQSGPIDVQVWEVKTGRLVATLGGHTNGVRIATYSPDGKKILTAAQGGIRLWDAGTGQELLTLENSMVASYASFSPDSQRVLADSWGTATIWDANTGNKLMRIEQLEKQVNYATYSPDGTKVALGGRNGVYALCDATTGKLITQFSETKNGVFLVVFSPDGRLLLGLDGTRQVRVWDIAPGDRANPLVATLDAHKDMVLRAAFSPDGKWIATASKDFTARLWPVSAMPLMRGKAMEQ